MIYLYIAIIWFVGMPVTMGVFKAAGRPVQMLNGDYVGGYIGAAIFWPFVLAFWCIVWAWKALYLTPTLIRLIFKPEPKKPEAIEPVTEHGQPLFSEAPKNLTEGTTSLRHTGVIPGCTCLYCKKIARKIDIRLL